MVSVKSVFVKGRGRKKRKAKAEERSRKKSEEAKVDERSRTKSKKEEKHPDHHRGCATLSEDIIATEILPRLPPTSLHRFKCVSSSWRSLISDPSFTRLHLDQSRTRPPQVLIAFIDSVNKKEIKFYAYDVGTNNNENNVARFLLRKKFREVQHDLFIVHHCNGLLLLSTKQNDGNDELHICNPSTREFITLPKSTQRDSDIYYTDPIRAGFAFIPDINAYKIARCYEYAYHIRFEVLTLGEASSWRLLPENSPYPIYTNKPLGVSSGEGIYFEIANNLRKPQSQFLCFNLRDEKFYVVDPPSMDIADYEYSIISDLEGHPCFIYSLANKTRFELWTSEDCRNHNWIHRYSISLEWPADFFWPVAVHHGKLLLGIRYKYGFENEAKLEYYDPCSKSFERLGYFEYYQEIPHQELRTKYGVADITYFVESLVSLQRQHEQ